MTINYESQFSDRLICWFCEKKPADPTLTIQIHLEKNEIVSRTSKRVNFNIEKCTIDVPQCHRCKAIREKGQAFPLIPTLIFFGLGGLFYYLFYAFTPLEELGSCLGFLASIIIAIAFQVLLSTRLEKKEGWTDEDKQIISKNPDNFPIIQKLREEGWLNSVEAEKQRNRS